MQRRARVLAGLRAGPHAEEVARKVYATLDGAARRARRQLTAIDFDIAELEDEPGELTIDGTAFEAALGPQAAVHGDAISALLADGLRLRLVGLDVDARRAALRTMIKLLPGIERLGPFVLSDYVDVALAEEDAALFWQIYVDRVAAEVKRRTVSVEAPREPWMLLALLRVHRSGPSSGKPAWSGLRLHVNRALRAARHRWRFIRQLAEDTVDVDLLHFLCVSSAMVDDPEALSAFFERGDAKLISCAIFALHVRGELAVTATRIVADLEARPLPEVGARLVEIYAQLHLLDARTPALTVLADGVRRIVQTQVAQGTRIDVLLEAVADDPRALRHCLLLADAALANVSAASAQLDPLLARVTGVWFQAFTPGGIAHPFNDEVFHDAVRRALQRQLQSEAQVTRLTALGGELGALSRRWGENPAARRQHLHRFIWAYARLVLPLAGAAATQSETQAAATALYQALIQLYIAHPSARGSGWLGAVESVMPAMFIDLVEGREDDARLAEAALLVAQVEAELRGASVETLATAQDGQLERPTVRAPVRIIAQAEAPVATMLATLSGWSTLRHLGQRITRGLGWRSDGEAIVTADCVLINAHTTRRGEPVAGATDRISLDALATITVRRPLRAFHLVAGASVLVGTAAYGGQLAYVGLRAAETGLAALGIGVIGVGLAFDAAAQHLARRAQRIVQVGLTAQGHHLVIEIDTDDGAPLLDALMAADARRRELAGYASLSANDIAWDGEASTSRVADAEADTIMRPDGQVEDDAGNDAAAESPAAADSAGGDAAAADSAGGDAAAADSAGG
ncbi:MAG: hypothetical protein ACI9U2_004070, partial [Bradymonadia bacterium]